MAMARTGTATATSQARPMSSRRAMITPPTIMIGAMTMRVRPMKTRVWTCMTSLVFRVISEGAPNRAISLLEKLPTWLKIEERRSRPKLIAVLAPK